MTSLILSYAEDIVISSFIKNILEKTEYKKSIFDKDLKKKGWESDNGTDWSHPEHDAHSLKVNSIPGTKWDQGHHYMSHYYRGKESSLALRDVNDIHV